MIDNAREGHGLVVYCLTDLNGQQSGGEKKLRPKNPSHVTVSFPILLCLKNKLNDLAITRAPVSIRDVVWISQK